MKLVEIKWWHNYANSPEFVVEAVKPDHDSFEYEVIDKGDSDFLLSVNNNPWVRFVSVQRKGRDGSPSMYGNAGGDFRLTNGEVYKTRTGWSSRASVVNKYYSDRLPADSGGLISEVVLKEIKRPPSKYVTHWAGFNLTLTALETLVAEYNTQHSRTQPLVHIVVHDPYGTGEIQLTPSIAHDKVVKP